MQTPTEFDMDRSRQRFRRRLGRDARLGALKAVGIPDRHEVLTEPAQERWRALIDQAHAAHETAHHEMEMYTFEPGTANQKDWSAIGDRSSALMAILMKLDELLDG